MKTGNDIIVILKTDRLYKNIRTMEYTREVWTSLFCFHLGELVSCHSDFIWDIMLFGFSSIHLTGIHHVPTTVRYNGNK